MSSYELSGAARNDLTEIVAYLTAEYSAGFALSTENELFDKFETLAAYPGLGHRRSDLTRLPVLFFLLDPYFIIYNRESFPVMIHAVLHSARNIRRVLKR